MPFNVLLLTATITPPPGAPSLVRVDPAQRRADHSQALGLYLDLVGKGVDRVLFVENSAADLTEFVEQAAGAGVGEAVEFVSCEGLDHPPKYGRAYGEFRLLKHAVDHAATLHDWQAGLVWKVTGRLVDMYLPAINRVGLAGTVPPSRQHVRADTGHGSGEESCREPVDVEW
jgi:hypothetical protein